MDYPIYSSRQCMSTRHIAVSLYAVYSLKAMVDTRDWPVQAAALGQWSQRRSKIISEVAVHAGYAGTSVSNKAIPLSPCRYPMLTSLAAWSP